MTSAEKIAAALIGAIAGLCIALGYMIIVDVALDSRDAMAGIDTRAIIREALQ